LQILKLDIQSKNQPRRENDYSIGERADYLKISLVKSCQKTRNYEIYYNKNIGHKIFGLDSYCGYDESKTKKHNKTVIFSTKELNPVYENYEMMLKWFDLEE